MSRGFSEFDVLYVDAARAESDLGEALERGEPEVTVARFEDPERAPEVAVAERFDCVLAADAPGELDGLELLEHIRDRDPRLPVVVATRSCSDERVREAMAAGAADVVHVDDDLGEEVLSRRVANAATAYRAERRQDPEHPSLRTIVDNLPGMVYRASVREPWPMTFVGGRVEELCGHTAEAIEADEVVWGENVILEEDLASTEAQVLEAVEAQETFEVTYRIETADDEVKHVWERGEPIYEDGEAVALEGFIMDVTEREEQARALREERAFTEAILRALPDPLYAMDTGMEPLRWSDRAEEITGYTAEEIVDRGALDFVADEDEGLVAEAIQRVLAGDGPATVEARLETKDGERIPFEFSGDVMESEDGEILGVAGVGRDISERLERERELERQNERLEEFVSVVSHDLRNPLQVAKGQIALASEDVENEHVDAAEDAVDRMAALIEDLLELARAGHRVEEPEWVDPGAVARRSWETVDTRDATLEIPDGDARIRADEGSLTRIFENLFANAAEHAGDDVTVRVRVRGGGFVVEDDGCGIPERERESVTEIGHTTSDSGTGLGLAIVRNLAEAHGWTVDVTDSERGGARFVFGDVAVDA